MSSLFTRDLMENRYIHRDTINQIENYYKRKREEIFGADVSVSYDMTRFNIIPRKFYEISLLKTFPFQKMKITRDIPKEEFIIDNDAPVVTTGVIIESKDVAAFLEGNKNYIGIDEKNNYYEVYLVSGEYILFEGSVNDYNISKKLEIFMEENNPDLLKKIKVTPKTDSKKEELVFEIWEYIYPMLNYCYDPIWSYYALRNCNGNIAFQIYESTYTNDYKNFHIGCYTYKELLDFVEFVGHKERFKEEKVRLYGQVYRPIKRKNHS